MSKEDQKRQECHNAKCVLFLHQVRPAGSLPGSDADPSLAYALQSHRVTEQTSNSTVFKIPFPYKPYLSPSVNLKESRAEKHGSTGQYISQDA